MIHQTQRTSKKKSATDLKKKKFAWEIPVFKGQVEKNELVKNERKTYILWGAILRSRYTEMSLQFSGNGGKQFWGEKDQEN